jgi:clan AA aspartic protease
MITGRVTSDREAVVNVRIEAPNGRSEVIEAVVDTGFTGFLALPGDVISRLGLPIKGLRDTILADGSAVVLVAYEPIVHWQGRRLLAPALEVEDEALLGMSLLLGNLLTMEIKDGGRVKIVPMGTP